MDAELAEVPALLGLAEHYIQTIGEVAAPTTVVEVVPHSKSGKRYARKRTTPHTLKNSKHKKQIDL